MKIIFITLFLLSHLAYSQNDDKYLIKLDSLNTEDAKCFEKNEYDFCVEKTADARREIYDIFYKQNKLEIEKLNLENANLDFLENKRSDFITSYSKLLNLDRYDNINIQNAIIRTYTEKYDNAKDLTFKFNNKIEVEKFITRISDILKEKIVKEQLKVIQEYYHKKVARTEEFINKNLKRLNINRKTFDEMSDNDKEILWKSFRND